MFLQLSSNVMVFFFFNSYRNTKLTTDVILVLKAIFLREIKDVGY